MSRSSCVLDKSGVILHSEGDSQVYPLYSITKTVIATLILELKLDLDRPVADWLDKSWLPRGDDINLKRLLNHTSGLRDYFSLDAYLTAVAACGDPWSDQAYAAQTLGQPLLFEPGQGWSYSNPGYWVLKRVCELESRMDFVTLVNERIADRFEAPLLHVAKGLFSDQLPTYHSGWVWHGLVCGTAIDAARFMHAPQIASLAKAAVPVPDAGPSYPRAAYGLGVMTDLDGTSYGHNGAGPGFSTSCFHFPETGFTISCFMSYDGSEDAAYDAMHELASRIGAI